MIFGKRIMFALSALLGLAFTGLVGLIAVGNGMPDQAAIGRGKPEGIPFAVLGDSNSHSYQDSISFPLNSDARGGPFRTSTFQWTEVLGRLRGNEIDMGQWGPWGQSVYVAGLRERIGLSGGRAPLKEDYLYNFASSGRQCRDLNGSLFRPLRQVGPLVRLMDREQERWREGIVVVRIGSNDLAPIENALTKTPPPPEAETIAANCAREIGTAIRTIRANHPTVRILLVGLGDYSSDPEGTGRYFTLQASANIRNATAAFNDRLKKLVDNDPYSAFFDDQAWFDDKWGPRTANNVLGHKVINIGGKLTLTFSLGNEPNHAVLLDRHAGMAWNALWAQSLVMRLREAFDVPISPISDAELSDFVLEPQRHAAPADAP